MSAQADRVVSAARGGGVGLLVCGVAVASLRVRGDVETDCESLRKDGRMIAVREDFFCEKILSLLVKMPAAAIVPKNSRLFIFDLLIFCAVLFL